MRQELSRVSDGDRDGGGSRGRKVSNSGAEFLNSVAEWLLSQLRATLVLINFDLCFLPLPSQGGYKNLKVQDMGTHAVSITLA
jgi:hypothetical protein